MLETIAAELIAAIREDDRVRDELAADGSLFEGYHPQMEAVHRANAARLRAIVAEHGWPGQSSVGAEAAEAAWRIAQHAISEPETQRAALKSLEAAIAKGEAPAWQAAHLEDRIRALEGRPQRFGTQLDWDESGALDVYPEIEDQAGVAERRRLAGLPPLEEALQRVRLRGEPPPSDLAERRRRQEAWAIAAGWRTK